MSYLRIRNWQTYQHYKNRRPVWVKLYVSQLRDHELKRLPISTRLLFDQLLLLAAEYENAIPKDFEELSSATRIPNEDVVDGVRLLVEGGWIQETSTKRRASSALAVPLANGYQDATLEKEKEEEKEPTGAQSLVAWFVDESVRHGKRPPSRVTGHVARQVGELLNEGTSAEDVQAGLGLLVAKGLNPSSLPSLVFQAQGSRPQSTAERLGWELHSA